MTQPPRPPARFAVASPAPTPAQLRTARAADLVDAVLAGRVFRDVVVVGTAIRGRLRPLTRAEARQVRADCRVALEAMGLSSATPGMLEGFPEWREERILRTLAVAVRDPDDPTLPLAGITQWETCTDVQLLALWDELQDFEAEIDPYSESGPPLSAEDAAAIVAASKKKDVPMLTSYGSRKLALFAITSTAAPTT